VRSITFQPFGSYPSLSSVLGTIPAPLLKNAFSMIRTYFELVPE